MKRALFSRIARIWLVLSVCLNLFIIAPAEAGSASLYFAASKSRVNVGDTFTASVYVNSGGVSINAANATVSFDPKQLMVSGVSRSGSIFSLWAEEPSYSNAVGSVALSGGLPTPGYTGKSGLVARVTFRALGPGSSTIRFANGAVLANDGQGTNVLAGLDTLTIAIQAASTTPSPSPAPQPTPEPTPSPTPTSVLPTNTRAPSAPLVTSSSHPNADTWYNVNRPVLLWDLPPDVTGVSVSIDTNENGDPGTTSAGLFNFYSPKTSLSDGAWYGHVRLENKFGWGPTGTRALKIDTTPPIVTEARIVSRGANQQSVEFTAIDASSSVDHVAVSLDGAQIAADVISPFTLPPLLVGDHTIELTAYDVAGNHSATQLFASILVSSSAATLFPNVLVMALAIFNLVFLFVIVLYEYRHRRVRQELQGTQAGLAGVMRKMRSLGRDNKKK